MNETGHGKAPAAERRDKGTHEGGNKHGKEAYLWGAHHLHWIPASSVDNNAVITPAQAKTA